MPRHRARQPLLGFERKLGGRFDAAVELNARQAARDEIDNSGTEDPDTGGAILYVTPRLLVVFGQGFVARLTVQVPAWSDLYGAQKEKAVINLGVTKSFF